MAKGQKLANPENWHEFYGAKTGRNENKVEKKYELKVN